MLQTYQLAGLVEQVFCNDSNGDDPHAFRIVLWIAKIQAVEELFLSQEHMIVVMEKTQRCLVIREIRLASRL